MLELPCLIEPITNPNHQTGLQVFGSGQFTQPDKIFAALSANFFYQIVIERKDDVVKLIFGDGVIANIPCREWKYLVYVIFLIISEGKWFGTGGSMAKYLNPYYLLLFECFIQVLLIEVFRKINRLCLRVRQFLQIVQHHRSHYGSFILLEMFNLSVEVIQHKFLLMANGECSSLQHNELYLLHFEKIKHYFIFQHFVQSCVSLMHLMIKDLRGKQRAYFIYLRDGFYLFQSVIMFQYFFACLHSSELILAQLLQIIYVPHLNSLIDFVLNAANLSLADIKDQLVPIPDNGWTQISSEANYDSITLIPFHFDISLKW